jgi:hypothetical protein
VAVEAVEAGAGAPLEPGAHVLIAGHIDLTDKSPIKVTEGAAR